MPDGSWQPPNPGRHNSDEGTGHGGAANWAQALSSTAWSWTNSCLAEGEGGTQRGSWSCPPHSRCLHSGFCQDKLAELNSSTKLYNYNSLLNSHHQENVGSHQKNILHIQGQRRSPKKVEGGAKSHLESNPICSRHPWRAQTKSCAYQETPQRLSQTCLCMFEGLLWKYRSAMAYHRGRN